MSELYLLRYYDWCYEGGITLGLFKTITDVKAYLVDTYEGRFDFASVVEPEISKYDPGGIPYSEVIIDGHEYGNCIVIEKVAIE